MTQTQAGAHADEDRDQSPSGADPSGQRYAGYMPNCGCGRAPLWEHAVTVLRWTDVALRPVQKAESNM